MSMEESKVTVKNIIIYTLGLLVIGFAVSFLLRADLGVGAWDATSFNLNDMIRILVKNLFDVETNITYGTTSFIISIILLIIVILYRGFKKKHLLVFASIFFMSLSIDLFNLVVFSGFHPEVTWIKIILFIVGLVTLPLGLALLIFSTLAASVYDEFTMVIGEVLKVKEFSTSKLLVEILGVFLAFIFSTIAYFAKPDTMDYSINGHLNLGTLIMTFTIGAFIALYLKTLKKITNKKID